MVGSAMLNLQINNREVMKPGGVSIVAIRDLFQMQPVMDKYVFNDLDNSEFAVLSPKNS